MDWSKLAQAVAPTLLGFGTGMITNNQARKDAKGQANEQRKRLEQEMKLAEQTEKNIRLMQQSSQPPTKEKSNLPLYIGLGVGGVVVLGVVIFAVTRNKS
jgi:hypothetical protein